MPKIRHIKMGTKSMKKILISDNPWQTRIAITRNGQLQNIFFESHSSETLERCFFKGTVTTVLPGIQTAFVDFGQEKAGFLHISEIDRELAIERIKDVSQIEEIKPANTRSRQPINITKILTEKEPILVQVSKEPVYEKGAKLTTCFTLPGRFAVLMPNIPRIGVSKKIESFEERDRLKEITTKLLPDGMGAIIRTSAEGHEEKEIAQDLKYLVQTWENIKTKYETAKPNEKLHEDLGISFQVVRDHLDASVEVVLVNNRETQKKLYSFIKKIAPEHSSKIKYYQEPPNLFNAHEIPKQIAEALEKKVILKCGGSIIVETAEAMTVIDVNTGRYTGKSRMEDTILKTNLEAAEEVVRQLKLRNIGGLIVIDFIDMASHGNRQKLFKTFEKELKEHDKFQSVVLKVSEFGLLQMTRKRSGKTLVQELTRQCECCKGYGFVKSVPTESYTILHKTKEELNSGNFSGNISLELNPKAFERISNIEYNSILELEKEFNCVITLAAVKDLQTDQHRIVQNKPV